MSLTIRKPNKPTRCRACGRAIGTNQYGSEVAITLTITLCCGCAYEHKRILWQLPDAINIDKAAYLPTAEPLKALTKIGGWNVRV